LGKKNAGSISGCTSYKVILSTIVPINIWQKSSIEKPVVYVIKEMEFYVK
jgi:hypothetical protein